MWVPPLLLERGAGIPRKETSRSLRQAGKIGQWGGISEEPNPIPTYFFFWVFKGIRRRQIVTTPTFGLLGAEPANFG